MKRYLLLFITSLTLLWSASCIAAPGELGDNGGINTNPHNLSSLSGNDAYKAVAQAPPGKETQICIFCHTPHGARPQTTLWSRPDPTNMGSFPIRTGLFIDDDPDIVNVTRYSESYSASSDYPNGTSKLCLSCHDGVTAMGILANGNEIDMTLSTLSGRSSAIDLSFSHPISFVYNDTVVGYLETQSPGSYIFPGANSAYLETRDGKTWVQCTTCHQPHQDTMATNGLPFWRAADYDTVCLACHQSDTYGLPGPKEHQYNP